MMTNTKTLSYRVGQVCKFIVLGLFLVIVLFPFVWMFLTSLKTSQAEIYAFPIKYLPENPSFQNYIDLFAMSDFGRYILNSVIVSVAAALGAVVSGLLGGYVIARYKFKSKKYVLFIFLLTQMLPGFVGLAPLYSMMSKLGLLNTLWSLIISYCCGNIPFAVVTLRGFFQSTPKSIEEAAQIDGCTRLQSIFRVIIPIMKPGIASTFIFVFVNSWNELFTAVMFIDVDKYKTIPVALNSFILKFDIKWGLMSAGAIIAVLPTILLFAYAQKYMAGGLTAGAVKG